MDRHHWIYIKAVANLRSFDSVNAWTSLNLHKGCDNLTKSITFIIWTSIVYMNRRHWIYIKVIDKEPMQSFPKELVVIWRKYIPCFFFLFEFFFFYILSHTFTRIHNYKCGNTFLKGKKMMFTLKIWKVDHRYEISCVKEPWIFFF